MGVVLGLVILVGLSVAHTVLGEGVDAGSFVRDGIGARAWGLAGAFVGISDDWAATVWNPAGLGQCDGIEIGTMHTDRFGLGINLQAASAVASLREGLGAGITLVRSAIDGIPFTGDEGDGVFSETQSVLLVSAGAQVLSMSGPSESGNPRLGVSVGASAKVFSHSLLEGRGIGIGIDLGAMGFFFAEWGVIQCAISMSDIGETEIAWTGTDHNPTNYVPWVNKFGVAGRLFEGVLLLSAEADLALGRQHLNSLSVGAEVSIVPQFDVRGGVVMYSDGQVEYAAGATVRWQQLLLDYAFVPHDVLGGSHVFSLGVDFESWRLLAEDDAT